MSQVRSIKSNSHIDQVKLLAAYRLARGVFEPEIPESEYEVRSPGHRNLDLGLWKERLNWKYADVLYVMRSKDESISAGEIPRHDQRAAQPETEVGTEAEVPSEIMLGMFLSYPRSRDGLESYHIFISAVHPSARGQGLFSILLDATKEYARSVGYHTLTVSTVPARFARMYEILNRDGSGWEVMKWEGGVGNGDRKVVMKMTI